MTNKKTITAFKGFSQDLSCRGFQYEIGKTYKHKGKVVRCAEGGFHSCENPMDVFSYYEPSNSRFCIVEASGEIDSDNSDSKIASAEITITAEISMPEFVKRAVEWVIERAKNSDRIHEVGNQSAASNTGNRSAASNTGNQSASEVSGLHSVAMAVGKESKARASEGSVIFLVYRNNDYEILHARSGIAGKDIKPDVWYQLDSNGEFVEVDNNKPEEEV